VAARNLKEIQKIGQRLEPDSEGNVPGTASVYSERVAAAVNIKVASQREKAARYGLKYGRCAGKVVASAHCGMNVNPKLWKGRERLSCQPALFLRKL